jgi:hypothetical protein
MFQAIICQNSEFFDEQAVKHDTFFKSQYLTQLTGFTPY